MTTSALIDQITTAYQQEQQADRTAVNADDIPISYESITAEWLTSVICRQHSGAKVVSYRLDTVDNGNTNRRRIFLDYNEAGRAAGLPVSLFCKATHGLKNRIMHAITGAMSSEVNFYNKVRPLLEIEAPRSYFAAYDAVSGNSIIMLGDLGDKTEFCTHTTEMTRMRVENQLRLLASFHGRFYESPELATTMSGFPNWVEYFEACARLGLEQSCDNGFVAAKEVIPARLFARRKEIWSATNKAADLHRRQPLTLTHNDVHLRNWYIAPNGEMGLGDWKCLHGHWSRDLAYTLATSMSVENRRLWENELIHYYFDQLQQVVGRSISFDGVVDSYRQQLLTAFAWWTVTLTPSKDMPDMQPRDSTIEFIKRIAVAIDDLDALDSFGTH